MTRARRLLLVLAFASGFGVVGVFGAVAWAFVSAPGSGSASAAVATLDVPTGVAVSSAGTTVHVTWTGVVAPDGSSTVGYWVQRRSGSAPTDACGSSQASPVSVGSGTRSCDDTSVASGAYTYTVTAVFRSWTRGSIASSAVTVTANVLDHFTIVAPSSATAGAAFNVTVSAKDASDSTLTSYVGTVHFSTSDPNTSVLPSDYTFVAGDNGSRTFSGAVTLKTAGVQTVAVNDTVQTSKTGTSSTITVGGSSLDHFVVNAPAVASVANAFVTATTSARDIYQNPASGWTSATRCVTFSGPGAAPIGTAPGYPAQGSCSAGQSSLSFDASGRATGFSITLYKAEATSLAVTGAAKNGTAGTTVVSPGTATGFLVSAPATATVGTGFTVTSLTARDAYNNIATGYSGAHTIGWSGPGSAPSGTAPTFPATSVSFAAGVSATALNATLVKAESATLTASESSGPLGSASISVSAGTATNFLVSAPATATVGTAFAVTSLTARDAFNNIATSYTGAHTIAWSGPGSAPSGSAPTFPATSVSFTAGASTTVLNATLVKAENATLTASSTSPTVSGSTSITVNAGTAAKLAWTNPASSNGSASGICLFTCTWNSIGRGNLWTAQVSVTDAQGNIATNVGSGHTVALTKTGGTLSVTSLTIPAAGPATSTTFTFTSQGSNSWTSDTVTAASSGYTNATVTLVK